MSSNITEEQLQNFCSITGAAVDRAKFYLEAANGDLDMAIGSFFEGGGSADTAAGGSQDIDEEFDDEEMVIRNSARQPAQPTPAARSVQSETKSSSKSKSSRPDKPRIATLRDKDSDEDEDDEEKGQAFYAGGSEHSGQQILGPPGAGKKTNVDDYIKNLFQKARDHGAEEVSSNEAFGQTSSRGPFVQSTGYRLGTGEGPSELIQGPPKPKPPKSHVLKLWKNGFTIDEETTLRLYDDPQNRDFLQSIERGEPPRELLRRAEGAEVHLDMQDQREQDYQPPKSKYVLYNDGYKLGSPTPTVVSNATPGDRENNEKQAKEALNLNESAPTTQLQIRLSDGSRLVIKANQTHTIREIRAYINRARPEYNGRLYSLSTQFPSKELTEESQSLKDANVLNAVIIQKLTS